MTRQTLQQLPFAAVRRSRHLSWSPHESRGAPSSEERRGRELIDVLELRPDDDVLDIGCDDGKLTSEIARRAWAGRVLGVDVSPELVAQAREAFGPMSHPNLQFEHADAAALAYREAFTAVISTGKLSAEQDQGALLEGLRRSLVPGGRCALQLWGAGHTAEIMDAFGEVTARGCWHLFFLSGLPQAYRFLTAEAYLARLGEAGLDAVEVTLLEDERTFSSTEAFLDWLRSDWSAYTERVPETIRELFVRDVADHFLRQHPPRGAGVATVRQVWLRALARRPLESRRAS